MPKTKSDGGYLRGGIVQGWGGTILLSPPNFFSRGGVNKRGGEQ